MTAAMDVESPVSSLPSLRADFARRRAELLRELSTIDAAIKALDGHRPPPTGSVRTYVEPYIYRRETRDGTVYEVKYSYDGRRTRTKCNSLLEARDLRTRMIVFGKITRSTEGLHA